MPPIDDSLGTVTRRGAVYDITLTRRIARPVEKVWAAIAKPERIADWFTEVELDPRPGGVFRLKFPQDGYVLEGVVLAYEPMRLFAYSWPDPSHANSVVRFELEPEGRGCRLTLTQTSLSGRGMNILAGWHVFLGGLPGAAEGVRTVWTRAHEDRVLARYEAALSA
jgi:uncharacterized protein YndB with AHSA1/START domain